MTRPRHLVSASRFTLRPDSSLADRLGSPRSPDANRKLPRVRSAAPVTAHLPREQHSSRTLLNLSRFQPPRWSSACQRRRYSSPISCSDTFSVVPELPQPIGFLGLHHSLTGGFGRWLK